MKRRPFEPPPKSTLKKLMAQKVQRLLRCRELESFAIVIVAEFFDDGFPIGAGQRYEDRANRFFFGSSSWSRDTGNGDGKVGASACAGAFSHLASSLFADGAVSVQGLFVDTE